MEVVPTYQTFVMLSWTNLGILVLGEYKYYTGAQLGGIGAAVAICLLGVKFLTLKIKQPQIFG